MRTTQQTIRHLRFEHNKELIQQGIRVRSKVWGKKSRCPKADRRSARRSLGMN